MSGVQAPTLSRSKHSNVWQDKRVVITRGPFKSYRGLVKAQHENGVDVDLEAKMALSGGVRHRFSFEQVILECRVECVMGY